MASMSSMFCRVVVAVLLTVPAFAQEPPAPRVETWSGGPVSDYEVPPRLVKQTKPKYPKDAFEKKIEGTVLVEFVVETKGHVRVARVIESIPALDKAALRAVRSWRFSAARLDGVPVRVIAQAPVSFCIDRSCVRGTP
jgi:periplasmic protein TonB